MGNKTKTLKSFARRAAKAQRHNVDDLIGKRKPLDESVIVENLREQNNKKKKLNKIFGIGYNKTGTTTLNEIFKIYGYSVPNQAVQERRLTSSVFNGRYSKLRKFVAKYDAFQDLPFSQFQTYIACDALFPNSKFILTIRDPDDWYRSIVNFHKKIFKFESIKELSEAFFKDKNLYLHTNYVYESKKRVLTRVTNNKAFVDWNLLYDEEHYKELYKKRNEDILIYFKDRPQDLLVIDLTKEKDTGKIVEFLGLSRGKIIPLPHENKT